MWCAVKCHSDVLRPRWNTPGSFSEQQSLLLIALRAWDRVEEHIYFWSLGEEKKNITFPSLSPHPSSYKAKNIIFYFHFVALALPSFVIMVDFLQELQAEQVFWLNHRDTAFYHKVILPLC